MSIVTVPTAEASVDAAEVTEAPPEPAGCRLFTREDRPRRAAVLARLKHRNLGPGSRSL